MAFPKDAPILSYSAVQTLREKDKNTINPLRIIAQAGAQERMLSRNADIIISGGSRGGSKSFSLVMEGLKDVHESTFSGLIVRNERDDLTQIIDYSLMMYPQYGTFNRARDDRTWNFNAGGKLRFSYYGDSLEDFKKRFQGKQFNYIGIDEITHIPYVKFKYLVTCNRNGMGLRNRICASS